MCRRFSLPDRIADHQLPLLYIHINVHGCFFTDLVMLDSVFERHKNRSRWNQELFPFAAVEVLFDNQCLTKSKVQEIGILMGEIQFVIQQYKSLVLLTKD